MAHPAVIPVLGYHLISFHVLGCLLWHIFDPNLSAAEEREEGTTESTKIKVVGENQVCASTLGKTPPSSSEPRKFKVSKGRGIYIYIHTN